MTLEAMRLCHNCSQEGEEEALMQSVRELVSLIPEDVKTPPDAYEARLAACRGCGRLLSGTCRRCGCFVELRAARKDMGCPDTPPKW